MTLFVTGGTGSLGHALATYVLAYRPDIGKLILFSRDEHKQLRMAETFDRSDRLAFRLGDVRDQDRLGTAMHGADAVIHAAALKVIGQGLLNPDEMVKTNCVGTLNVLTVAMRLGVPRVLIVSSDKGVAPINFYGATKQVAEGLAVGWHRYGRGRGMRVAAVRYGNVLGSRGSVLPIFRRAKAAGLPLPVSDPSMTRFCMRLPQAAECVIRCLEQIEGGEVFVPKLPSFTVSDLAEAVDPGGLRKLIGVGAGEKMHETLISWAESGRTDLIDQMYVIRPPDGPVPPGSWDYESGRNRDWLTVEHLVRLCGEVPEERL